MNMINMMNMRITMNLGEKRNRMNMVDTMNMINRWTG